MELMEHQRTIINMHIEEENVYLVEKQNRIYHVEKEFAESSVWVSKDGKHSFESKEEMLDFVKDSEGDCIEDDFHQVWYTTAWECVGVYINKILAEGFVSKKPYQDYRIRKISRRDNSDIGGTFEMLEPRVL